MALLERLRSFWQRLRGPSWSRRTGITAFLRKNISVVIAVGILFVVAGMSGYSVYVLSNPGVNGTVCDQNLGNCVMMLGGCNSTLIACRSEAESSNSLYTECSADLAQASASADEMQSRILDYDRNVTDIQSRAQQCEYEMSSSISSSTAEIEELNSQLADMQAQFNALVQNSAKSICCVQKVYNPGLKYYYLSNSTVVCTADTGNDTKEFGC